jgi:hypothetical protein
VHARDCRARLVNSGGDSSFAKEKRVRKAKKEKELTQETPESIKTKKKKSVRTRSEQMQR